MSSYYIPKWKRHEAKVEADKNYYGTLREMREERIQDTIKLNYEMKRGLK